MKEQDLILGTCLHAGRIMMENGSEVYRVEDTMTRIAANAGYPQSISYVTATGIFMSLRQDLGTQMAEVHERSINLEKVVAVNRLSRLFAEKKITIEELSREIRAVDTVTPSFPLLLQALMAGVVSCTLMYIFGGAWHDFIATFIIGAMGYVVSVWVRKSSHLRLLDMFVSAFAIGATAILAVHFHIAGNTDNIIIGAVMPLVPGVAITTSFRDILSGDLLSGTARGIEALFIAAAIGAGIATSLLLIGGTIWKL